MVNNGSLANLKVVDRDATFKQIGSALVKSKVSQASLIYIVKPHRHLIKSRVPSMGPPFFFGLVWC